MRHRRSPCLLRAPLPRALGETALRAERAAPPPRSTVQERMSSRAHLRSPKAFAGWLSSFFARDYHGTERGTKENDFPGSKGRGSVAPLAPRSRARASRRPRGPGDRGCGLVRAWRCELRRRRSGPPVGCGPRSRYSGRAPFRLGPSGGCDSRRRFFARRRWGGPLRPRSFPKGGRPEPFLPSVYARSTSFGPVWLPPLLFAALAAGASLAWGTEARAPGRLARALVGQAQVACADQGPPRAIQVPIVGVSWLCFEHDPPRLVGAVPGGGGTFSSSALWISDDLTDLRLSDMHLLLGSSGTVRVHAEHTSNGGVSPLGRPSNLRPWARAGLLSMTGALLALLGAAVVLRSRWTSRALAVGVGGIGPAASLLMLSALERRDHGHRFMHWSLRPVFFRCSPFKWRFS